MQLWNKRNSRPELKPFFKGLISQLLKLCVTAMSNRVFMSFSTVQTYDLSYIHLKTVIAFYSPDFTVVYLD